MPRNYPEVWVGRVEKLLSNTESAPWLDGIPEVASDHVTLGEGTATEKNLIHIPTSEFEPTVLINNTAYPLALEQYDDDTVTISLDMYDTKPTELSDNQVMGAAYDVIDSAIKTHPETINKSKYARAIHAMAPVEHVADKTPVIKTTGDNDGAGRKIMTRKDIVALKKEFDKMQVPLEGRRLVLCADHVADMLENDQKFADQYYNYQSGKISKLYGFEVYEYGANPNFNGSTGKKCSFGSVPVAGTDFQASVAFYVHNIAKKTGKTKQYYRDAKTSPETQSNVVNYKHFFIAVPKMNRYSGAIISTKI